jgi:Flp pilus assembly protein TadB
MDEERIGIELIVSVIAWFAVVLLAFFFVGAVVGVIAILLGALLFIWWLVRAIRTPEKRQ